MYLSVIIPAYNEEKHIRSTVEDISHYLRQHYPEHEIIVVTDGSKDKTNEIVRDMLAGLPTLKLLDYDRNQGKGYAVKEGMLAAKGDILVFTDADNSTTIDHLEIMLPYLCNGEAGASSREAASRARFLEWGITHSWGTLSEGGEHSDAPSEDCYEVIIGSIAVKGHTVAKGSEPPWRRLFGKIGNLFIQIMAVPGIHDTQRGFKIFTAKAAQDIFSRLTIKRFGFDVEALALARKFGYRIKEVPVQWQNDPDSSVSLKSYFQVLGETAKVRWNLLTGAYK